MLIKVKAASAGGGIKFGHLMGRLVNRPLLTTPRRALTLFGVLAPRAGVRADDAVSWVDDDGGPVLLSSLVASASAAPRLQGPRDEGRAYRVQGGVAIIPVVGDLVHDLGSLDPWCGMTGYDGIVAKLDIARADPDVRGVMIYDNSPGGEVSGVASCGDCIRDFQMAKPLRTVYADAGYSAACWLGSQAERVYAPRTGGTGSIGVVTLHVDQSGAYDDAGVKVTVLHAGAHKADGHSFAPLPDAVAADIVAELESLRGHFAAAVASGRDIDVAAVMATEARCLSADESLDLGLIDEILNPDDALAQFIADLAGDTTTISIPAAPAGITAKGVAMAKQQAAGKSAKSIPPKAKSRPKSTARATAAAKAEGEDGDDECADGDGSVCESCPHCDKDRADPPCRDCPDNPGAGDGGGDAKAGEADDDDVEDDDDLEDDDDEDVKTSAKSATARIKAILTAPEAKASPALAEKLAFSTNLSPKAARSVLKAAAADAQSGTADPFAAAMAVNAGPKLGAGIAPARSDGWDNAFAKAAPAKLA